MGGHGTPTPSPAYISPPPCMCQGEVGPKGAPRSLRDKLLAGEGGVLPGEGCRASPSLLSKGPSCSQHPPKAVPRRVGELGQPLGSWGDVKRTPKKGRETPAPPTELLGQQDPRDPSMPCQRVSRPSAGRKQADQ